LDYKIIAWSIGYFPFLSRVSDEIADYGLISIVFNVSVIPLMGSDFEDIRDDSSDTWLDLDQSLKCLVRIDTMHLVLPSPFTTCREFL